MPIGIASQQQDLFAGQSNCIDNQQDRIKKMLDLAKSITKGMDSADLARVQQEIAELQRQLDALKQAEEKIAKAMDKMNEYIKAN